MDFAIRTEKLGPQFIKFAVERNLNPAPWLL